MSDNREPISRDDIVDAVTKLVRESHSFKPRRIQVNVLAKDRGGHWHDSIWTPTELVEFLCRELGLQ